MSDTLPPAIDEEFLSRLPASAGVYILKDAKGRAIYIGKAINLRSRVRSYFRATPDARLSVPFLQRMAHSVETIITDNEKEALLLENTLIKKHKPRYNIRLRDDKTYISLRLDTTHKWPRLHRVRKRKRGDKALYFGPYASSTAVNETMRFLQRLFPLRSCTDSELARRIRPCMLHQIDRCCAPCVGLANPEEYARFVEQTQLFLRGRHDDVARLLRAKMEQYSEALLFEKAALVRDHIAAMRETVEEEKVHIHRAFDRDVLAFARRGGQIVFCVLGFRRGKLERTDLYALKDTDLDEPEMVEGFLSQFYDTTRDVPLDILIPSEPANREFLETMLSGQRNGPVHLRVPMRGQKRRLMEMAAQNAEAELERVLGGARLIAEAIDNLQHALKLSTPPRVIHCFDISNFQGAFPVGAMVCFRDGEPDKSNYRRFRIKNVEGQNDFAMMREVLSRQYAKLLPPSSTPDESSSAVSPQPSASTSAPDLVVIDGGIGQLNAAIEAVRAIGLFGAFPIVGLAKSRLKDNLDAASNPDSIEDTDDLDARVGSDEPSGDSTPIADSRSPMPDKVRTQERVFLPGRKNPVTFRRSDPALHLLERLRDETHRFAITYHRLLRAKSALRSGLEEIPGIGAKRAARLLRHFGSLARIKAASLDQLLESPGMTEPLVRQVHAFFHPAPESGSMEHSE